MFGLDPLVLIVMATAMIVAGAVKGLVGIALPAVAIAILTLVLEPVDILPLLCLPIVATNFWQAVHAGSPLEPLRRFWLMILCMLVALWWSAHLVVRLEAHLLYGLIGSVLVIFTLTNLTRPHLRLSPRAERIGGPLAGIVGGLLGGVSTMWGPPMAAYFVLIGLSKEAFIRATGLVWLVATVPLVWGYLDTGLLNARTAPLSALATLPALLGFWLGSSLRNRINQEVFRKVLLVALLLIGLNLVRRALF